MRSVHESVLCREILEKIREVCVRTAATAFTLLFTRVELRKQAAGRARAAVPQCVTAKVWRTHELQAAWYFKLAIGNLP